MPSSASEEFYRARKSGRPDNSSLMQMYLQGGREQKEALAQGGQIAADSKAKMGALAGQALEKGVAGYRQKKADTRTEEEHARSGESHTKAIAKVDLDIAAEKRRQDHEQWLDTPDPNTMETPRQKDARLKTKQSEANVNLTGAQTGSLKASTGQTQKQTEQIGELSPEAKQAEKDRLFDDAVRGIQTNTKGKGSEEGNQKEIDRRNLLLSMKKLYPNMDPTLLDSKIEATLARQNAAATQKQKETEISDDLSKTQTKPVYVEIKETIGKASKQMISLNSQVGEVQNFNEAPSFSPEEKTAFDNIMATATPEEQSELESTGLTLGGFKTKGQRLEALLSNRRTKIKKAIDFAESLSAQNKEPQLQEQAASLRPGLQQLDQMIAAVKQKNQAGKEGAAQNPNLAGSAGAPGGGYMGMTPPPQAQPVNAPAPGQGAPPPVNNPSLKSLR